ncbi:DUF3347 domain-containing protein [Psychroflexus sediminis]|uniref:DUF3347 domain-containing protein n=3 Tax=Psychroflexus TaxID=83612 RepID=A0A1G7UET4_9FLAO|nr:DUF3347 domain-containing protein [Psychroflexus sediminis]NEV94434.1 DUF3347 domain-containing protein [Psychroflexus aurantiacus]SDG45818.1 Protein of unknown function [Psychroflexus sediminis]
MKSKKTTLVLTLIFIGFGAFAQHKHAHDGEQKEMSQNMDLEFKDQQLGEAFEHYIHLKEALVASKTEVAKKAAGKLEASLENVNGGETAKTAVTKFSSSTGLEEQREAFKGLSLEMLSLVKAGELSKGEVYLEYCPMAKASWLSTSQEIRNPYYGDKMLKCGTVKETIK